MNVLAVIDDHQRRKWPIYRLHTSWLDVECEACEGRIGIEKFGGGGVDLTFCFILCITSPSNKMGRLRTKGKAGAAKAYVTRSSAVKRLQCSLADFRRLCILKGRVLTCCTSSFYPF